MRWWRGVSDAALERVLLDNLGDGAPLISVHHLFEAAEFLGYAACGGE